MPKCVCRSVLLLAGVSAAALLSADPALAWQNEFWGAGYGTTGRSNSWRSDFPRPFYDRSREYDRLRDYDRPRSNERSTSDTERTVTKKRERAAEKEKSKKADKTPSTVPPGQLHIIVSIKKQRVTLFANGAPV